MKSIIVLSFLLSSIFVSHSQKINFERIGIEEGLSQVSVNTIAMDSLGNMWFGTRNGLNRYNGDEIMIFRSDRSSANSIIGNHIKKINTDGSKVWIYTLSGISCFDIINEKFTNYPIVECRTFCILKGKVLIGTIDGIFWLSEDEKRLLPIPTAKEIKSVQCLQTIGDKVLIGTNENALIFDPHSGTKQIMGNVDVRCILKDNIGNIWIGTFDKGLYKIHNNQIANHFFDANEISHPTVRCIEEDNNGNIWVGTFLGLNCITPDNKTAIYKYNKNDPTSLSHNSIWDLYKDRTGAMWAGTYFGGVDLFHPTQSFIRTYRQNNEGNKSINYRVVGSMVEDVNNNLWICTEGGGLNLFDRKTNKFSYYTHSENDPSSISHNTVKAIFKEGDSILWLGTFMGGLNKFNIKTRKFTNYNKDNKDFLTSRMKTISDIIPYDGKYLLSSNQGIVVFDPITEHFTPFFPDSLLKQAGEYVNCALIDSRERLWIGKYNNGLSLYDLKTKSLRTYQYSAIDSSSIANNMVYKIFEDHYGRIWIATANGVNIYNNESDNFETYSTNNGLAGNAVFGISQSRYGDLIFSTNKGVSFFNYDTRNFRNLTAKNGFPLNELNEDGLYVTEDGEVIVGGIDGMCSFNEKDFLNQKPNSKPVITKLTVNNKTVNPFDKSKLLTKNITLTSHLDLQHIHTGFSFHFHDMSYLKADKQILEYQLIGFDQDWLQSTNNSATYTNLDPGDYTFVVRNTNYPEQLSDINLTVHPPLYSSTPAFILYCLIVIIIIFYLNRLYLSRKRLNDKLILNQSQFKFFTNISHEFRTPLTIINGQTEALMEEKTIQPKTYKKILQIHKNTSRLNNLISELLDFRKQELGHLKIKASCHNICEFINEIYLSFIELAHHSEIDYQININEKHIPLWFDYNHLEKVFYNLLSNAFKFTPQKGRILINIKAYDSLVKIEITDSGSGITKEHINRIFDRYYQLENVTSKYSSGTGIGLALSKGIVDAHKGNIDVKSTPGSGSTFIISLPKGNEHFSEDELSIKDNRENIVMDKVEKIEILQSHNKDAQILIVEDNKEVQQFLNQLLSPFYVISLADDGLQGLEKATELQPDLIISDVVMPQMSGTEMCSKLKTNFKTSHLPIILLTARTAEAHKIEGLETGADDYITKPFNTKILISRVNNLINNRKALHDKFKQAPSAPIKKLVKSKIDKEFIEEAHKVILKNIDNPGYDVIAFANDMKLGRTSLFTKIKGITGQTPNNYINTIKLNKASELLREQPNLTISEVAYACGFSAPHYFSKSFKTKFGINPSELRSSIE
ncbi:MAG: response regulator [Carboxylicivirga sp.]|jgi:signal transduction histidine kinase/ligand-binding sensor domain-containing protein/DNA-binding NarL/FixJ family response regulator|nr:response regulator [Carboxylicivirga sp.]